MPNGEWKQINVLVWWARRREMFCWNTFRVIISLSARRKELRGIFQNIEGSLQIVAALHRQEIRGGSPSGLAIYLVVSAIKRVEAKRAHSVIPEKRVPNPHAIHHLLLVQSLLLYRNPREEFLNWKDKL